MEIGTRFEEWEDAEWFAIDRDGCVAVFTTAGVGPVPSELIARRQDMLQVSAFIRNSSAVGSATMLFELPNPNDYIEIGTKGLFGYDWTDVSKRKVDRSDQYEMLVFPSNPIRVEDLPEQIADLIRAKTFSEIRFSSQPAIGGFGAQNA